MIRKLENMIFGNRRWVVGLFVVVTVFMAWSATSLRVDAGFSKLLPLDHEYMQTFAQYRLEFGGANRVLIALMAKDGNMFTPEFFEALKVCTDEVFFIPGVDRSQVSSLFTPNVRFTEVVEDGIAGGAGGLGSNARAINTRFLGRFSWAVPVSAEGMVTGQPTQEYIRFKN